MKVAPAALRNGFVRLEPHAEQVKRRALAIAGKGVFRRKTSRGERKGPRPQTPRIATRPFRAAARTGDRRALEGRFAPIQSKRAQPCLLDKYWTRRQASRLSY